MATEAAANRAAPPGRAAEVDLEQAGVHQPVEVEGGDRARHAKGGGNIVAALLTALDGNVLVDAPAQPLVQHRQCGQRVALMPHDLPV
jgi:hypothetical protein